MADPLLIPNERSRAHLTRLLSGRILVMLTQADLITEDQYNEFGRVAYAAIKEILDNTYDPSGTPR